METTVSMQGLPAVSPPMTKTAAQVARATRLKSQRAHLRNSPSTKCTTCKEFGCKKPVTILVSEGKCGPCAMKHCLQSVCKGELCTNVARTDTSKKSRSYCKTCRKKYLASRPGYCMICRSFQDEYHGHCEFHKSTVCGRCHECHECWGKC